MIKYISAFVLIDTYGDIDADYFAYIKGDIHGVYRKVIDFHTILEETTFNKGVRCTITQNFFYKDRNNIKSYKNNREHGIYIQFYYRF